MAKRKPYVEVNVDDIIERLGGEEALKKLDVEDIVDRMMEVADKMVDELFEEYKEVGEVFGSELWEYAEDIKERSGK